MNPTLITLDGSRLCVDAPYHPQIVERLRLCRGEWDKAAKLWWVDAAQGDKLLEALPKASYSFEALCACWDAQAARVRHFAESLAQMGVRLVLEDGAVVAVGEAVSPLVQQLVAERSDSLRAWANVEMGHKGRNRGETIPPFMTELEVTHADRLIFTGMQNAAKREEEQRAMRGRMYRRKAMEQAELWEEKR